MRTVLLASVGTSGRCGVSGHKHAHPKASASRSELFSSRDPFIFRACRDSHHERAPCPDNTSFAWNGRHQCGSY